MNLDLYCPNSKTLEYFAWHLVSGLSTFTVDDLHVMEDLIRVHHRDRRVLGAILKSLEARGLIRKIGYESSRRSECHGRPVMRWKVVQNQQTGNHP